MSQFLIYCDDLQEGMWFKNLNPRFNNATLKTIPANRHALSFFNKSFSQDKKNLL